MNCNGCYWDMKASKGCEAFTERPKDCWNKTTPKEAAERIRDMERYTKEKQPDDRMKREGKMSKAIPSSQVWKKHRLAETPFIGNAEIEPLNPLFPNIDGKTT